MPGGHQEKGETYKSGLLRELREETGFTIASIGKKLIEYECQVYARDTKQFENSLKRFFFVTDLAKHDKRYIFRKEIRQCKWMELSKITSKNFSIHHLKAIEMVRKSKSNLFK